MSTSRQKILTTAAAEEGYKEAYSNRTKYGLWYGADGNKWCAMFVSWVYDQAGYRLDRIDSDKGYASCQNAYDYWERSGNFTNDPESGDIVLFDLDNNKYCDHTGIFDCWVDVRNKKEFYSWEGNTGSNYDQVKHKLRKIENVKAFVCPSVLQSSYY